jgi:thioredoxin 1
MLITTDNTFDQDISSWICLVDFWAEWCGPCRAMLPKMEELSDRIWDKAKIMKINVDENPKTSEQFRIMSIPTMILFKDWKPIEQFVWMQDINELEKKINALVV